MEYMGQEFAASVVLPAALIVCSESDIRSRIIPDMITLPLIAVAIILYGWQALAGALAGAGSLFFAGAIFDFVQNSDTIGGGDIKLLAMIGALAGAHTAMVTFCVAPLFGIIIGFGRQKIPYGICLSLAAILYIIYSLTL